VLFFLPEACRRNFAWLLNMTLFVLATSTPAFVRLTSTHYHLGGGGTSDFNQAREAIAAKTNQKLLTSVPR
jgi:hypothetical protein